MHCCVSKAEECVYVCSVCHVCSLKMNQRTGLYLSVNVCLSVCGCGCVSTSEHVCFPLCVCIHVCGYMRVSFDVCVLCESDG